MSRRRSQARPRWIESARYPSRCGDCGAETKAGDTILYRPGQPPLCKGCGVRAREREGAERKAARGAAIARGLDPREVYEGSDAALTRLLCSELTKRGPAGRVAALLFRAQKSSRRAKMYGRTSYRGLAYGRKGESLRELAAALAECDAAVGVTLGWGWGRDESSPNPWVLYVDLPLFGQVSFHSPERYDGPDYAGEWDGRRASEERIVGFCQHVLSGQI